MNRLPKDFMTVVRGAEYVIAADNSIVIVSSGGMLEISTDLTKGEASVLMLRESASPDSAAAVLFTGSPPAVMQAYLDLRAQLAAPVRRCGRHGTVLKTLVAALLISAVAFAAHLPLAKTTQVTTPAMPSALGGIPHLPGLPDIGTVLDKPDFIDELSRVHTLPSSQTSARSENPAPAPLTPNAEQAAAATPETSLDDEPLLPSYKPTLYVKKDGTAKTETPGDGAKEAADVVPEVASTKTDVKPTDKTVSPTPKPDPAATEKAETKTDTPSPALSAEEKKKIEADAEAAVQKLMGNGTDVKKLLLSLQHLGTVGEDGVTEEMLGSLPPEMAKLLTDSGVGVDIGAQEDGGGTMRILPNEVIDHYRGKDGIASIPENYSWYSRKGGAINLPWPGGGDIKRVEDFKAFGLKP
jgi:hypothetical protein